MLETIGHVRTDRLMGHHQRSRLYCPRDRLEGENLDGKQRGWPCLGALHGLQFHPKGQGLRIGRQCFLPKDLRLHCCQVVLLLQLDSKGQGSLLFAGVDLGPEKAPSVSCLWSGVFT